MAEDMDRFPPNWVPNPVGTFALACWTLKDIHDHRKEMELPPWSDDEAEGWLIANESKMEERMIEAGWDYISLNMS